MAGNPNVLIVMADELRNDITLHQWYPFVRTPIIDELRSRGTTFTQAFCQTPTCVPSRGSFTVGKYPHQIGLYDHSCVIPGAERTIGHHFAANGYRTVAFGKTHNMCPGFESHTYDIAATMATANHGYNVSDDDAVGVFEADEEDYCDFVAVRQFEEFLTHRDRNADEPFVAFLGIYAPHPPLYPPRRYAEMYADAPVDIPEPIIGEDETKPERHGIPRARWRALSREAHEAIHRVELGMITMIDDLLGRALAALGTAGVADDTIVVFTSDHGDQMGEHEMLGKFHHTYDGSMRVPLILAGPGVPGGCAVDDPAGLIDVYPTLCVLAGVRPPEGDHELAGRSLAECWAPGRASAELDHDTASGRPSRRDAVFCQFRNAFVARTREWKLVHDPTDRSELYDLADDPREAANLYDDPAHQSIQLELTKRLVDHLSLRRRGEIAHGRNGFFG